MRARWAMMLAGTLTVLMSAPAIGAAATAPVTLGDTYVFDQVDALSLAEEASAEARLEQLKTETGIDLWVVFVDEFTDPANSEEWALETAQANGLGPTQYLLAVAVDSRQFYLSGDSEGPVTFDQLGIIEQQQIQPALADEDWGGAIEAAADGLTDAVGGVTGGDPGTDPGAEASGGIGFGTLLLWLVIAAIVIVVIVLIVRSRRKKPGVTGGRAGGIEQLSTRDLERQAGSALVATDDAVKTSEEELGFARAQFGDAATAEFAATLASAKESLDRAFALKQRLDDSTTDSEADTRAWNAAIVRLCQEANAGLDEKAADFDELRKLEQNAPEALERVQEQRRGAEGPIAQAEATLTELAGRYAATALATIADNPEQARERLVFADAQLAEAQSDLGAGRGGEAAVGIRAAEEAVGQSRLLSEAVGKLAADLGTAESSIAEVTANLQQDIAAASALPDVDGRVASAVAAAQAAVAQARTATAAPALAPLQVLRVLEGANTQIDGVIAGVRDAQAAAQRASQQLGQLILRAQAQVSAAEDYITSRRGAVDAEARTRLAEAGASLVQAQQLQSADPVRALEFAQRADRLAGQAIQSAQSDVAAFQNRGVTSSGGGAGGMVGAVLGGIVINSLLGGGGSTGRGGSTGGVFGGGAAGGGSGRSAGPASFGGGGTRSRRGGGRF